MTKGDKKASRSNNPSNAKLPRGGGKVTPIENKTIVWQLGIIDKEGPWGWKAASEGELWDTLHDKIKDYETMTFEELMGKNRESHPISCSKIISKAQRRLDEISQSDLDDLFSIRISAKQRLWGVRDRNIFKILWWDPNHEVCPSQKKHT